MAATKPAPPATAPAITWRPWADDQFARAKAEHKLVLLDLQAVWCHWCHVMDATTYADPLVEKLMGDQFIAIRVDQDSRPDISNRYEDYGWPATVVFDGDGHEIVKRRGYIPPAAMISMLKAIIADPTPGPSIQPEVEVRPADAPTLTDAQRHDLIGRLSADYDERNEGWFGQLKYLDPGVAEYCLIDGDAHLRSLATRTLDANLKLIDPVWGGVDQYSTDSDWDHPHFEKIMSTQTGNLRLYTQAFLLTGDARYLHAARQIDGYLAAFLTSPEGAFYVSQDADLRPGEHGGAYFALADADRRKLGVPRVDQHVYARENGWAIDALGTLYTATGERQTLDRAIAASNWIISNRALDGGGFRHDAIDPAGPYLGDTLAMGRAFLKLYQCTADRAWLARARDCMKFIQAHFIGQAGASGGLATTAIRGSGMLATGKPEIDENIDAARFADLLFAYTGDTGDRELAVGLMRYLASPQIWSDRGWAIGGILLADHETATAPLHITIVGSKSDSTVAALFQTAQTASTALKRIDWFDPAEGKLPNSDVQFPLLPNAAAFVCTGSTCSSPIRTPQALAEKLRKLQQLQ